VNNFAPGLLCGPAIALLRAAIPVLDHPFQVHHENCVVCEVEESCLLVQAGLDAPPNGSEPREEHSEGYENNEIRDIRPVDVDGPNRLNEIPVEADRGEGRRQHCGASSAIPGTSRDRKQQQRNRSVAEMELLEE
jgi:hypothetical protein